MAKRRAKKCVRFKHLKLCALPAVEGYTVMIHGKHDTFPLSKKFRTARAALTHAKGLFR